MFSFEVGGIEDLGGYEEAVERHSLAKLVSGRLQVLSDERYIEIHNHVVELIGAESPKLKIMPNNDDSFNQLGSPCYVARLMYEAMDHCERRYRAYDPKDPWIMVDNDNKLHSYASKKPNQLNNFGPCWVVVHWLVDHPEVAEQFGIKVGFV